MGCYVKMKTKTGEQITGAEFLRRWKIGIQKVTQLQQIKINLVGSTLMLAGVLFGLIIMFATKVWWLFIILLGSLFLVGVGFVGTLQKYWVLKEVDKLMKGGIKDE